MLGANAAWDAGAELGRTEAGAGVDFAEAVVVAGAVAGRTDAAAGLTEVVEEFDFTAAGVGVDAGRTRSIGCESVVGCAFVGCDAARSDGGGGRTEMRGGAVGKRRSGFGSSSSFSKLEGAKGSSSSAAARASTDARGESPRWLAPSAARRSQ